MTPVVPESIAGRGWLALLGVFALALHILLTLNLGEVQLRVGTSDLLLPVAGLALFWLWRAQGYGWPQWKAGHVWIWLVVLTAWVLVSLVNGRLEIGQWIVWASINKGIGWFVLLGYFLVGAGIVHFLDEKGVRFFLRAFLLVGWVIAAYALLFYLLVIYRHLYGVNEWIEVVARPVGFMENPNAYSILLSVLFLVGLTYMRENVLFPRWLSLVGSIFILAVIYFNFSRSAFLGLGLGTAFLLFVDRKLWRDFFVVVFGAVVAVLCVQYGSSVVANVIDFLFSKTMKGLSQPMGTYAESISHLENIIGNTSAQERVESLKVSLSIWWDSPFLGGGIGSYYHTYRDVEGLPDTIHSTPLWILAEMGAFGFVLFGAFFILVFWRLVVAARKNGDTLALAVAAALLVYAGASVGTEVMYQRHLWVLVGLALVVPRRAQA